MHIARCEVRTPIFGAEGKEDDGGEVERTVHTVGGMRASGEQVFGWIFGHLPFLEFREGEAPAEPKLVRNTRLGRSLALPLCRTSFDGRGSAEASPSRNTDAPPPPFDAPDPQKFLI